MIHTTISAVLGSILLASVLTSCGSFGKQVVNTALAERYTPTNFGDRQSLDELGIEELRELNLVATNLVSILLQVPELEPMNATFQVTRPISAFGNVLVRAMEDAGIALQLVALDMGENYVSYGQSFSVTDTGSVIVFTISVNDVELSREFVTKSKGIYPASLVSIDGTDFINSIDIDDSIFTEQGGDDSFLSGVRSDNAYSDGTHVVSVKDYERIPVDKQRSRESVVADARRRFFLAAAERAPSNLSNYDRYRRTVLIFADMNSLSLGSANKASLRMLVREFDTDDVLLIKACTDVDGINALAQDRAIRVEEEFLSHKIPMSSVFIAPCAQTNYRHSSDNSPVPVEVVHYRAKVNRS